MIIDSMFWWIGCLVSYGAAVFVLWFSWCLLTDFIFRTMKAQKEFMAYLQWKRNDKIKKKFPRINTNFDAWLKTECFQKPTNEAYALAKTAWKAALKVTP